MNKRIFNYKRQQAGFSLIEIMVAVVISMIAMIVVLQIFGSSEAKKRATTGGNDAQMGGALALSGLQRDVRQAGYGLASMNLLGCDITLPSGGTFARLAPVTINHKSIPAGDTGTDTLLIAYGVSDGTPEGDLVSTMPPGDLVFAMNRSSVFSVNDWVIAAPPKRLSPCNLVLDQVSAVSPSPNITVKTKSPGMSFGTVFNLGHDNADSKRGPQLLAYRVFNGNLTVCDYMAKNCGDATKKEDATYWVPIASNIVSLRAQYGRDSKGAMDGIVDIYDQATPEDTSDPKFVCNIARISAVRLALVARSGDYDKDAPVTASATPPVWEGSADVPIDLTAGVGLAPGTTWQNYRYKVFQTVVPIRTMTWLGSQPGC